ncbi:MAG: SCO family protein [Myxococcales bacterium]|nr:SCO family protein [Myxococcales bacterium]
MTWSLATIAPFRSRMRVLAVVGAVCLTACGAGSRSSPAPVLGAIPPFELVDQDANGFGTDELAGSIWIADFIFTRCPDMCPMLSSVMARVQSKLAKDPAFEDVRLVSISVDPEHDTPALLTAYAEKYGADPDRWTFVTGPREEIWRLSRDGFRLPVGDAPGNADAPILHSEKFVLTDRQGRIRGYYDALDQKAQLAMMRDIRLVANEPADAAASPAAAPPGT